MTIIKDSFKALVRKSRKQTGIFLINILGLSVGIAVFVLILTWIDYETGYDKSEKSGNVYRLIFGENTYLTAGEGPYFAENCFEIEKVARFKTVGDNYFSFDNNQCKIENLRFADSTVFDIFPYELILGDREKALATPGTVVITESISEILFGKENPLGRSVLVNGEFEIVVTGLMKDTEHTFNPTDVLASFVTLGLLSEEPDFLESLETSQFQTYFLLKENIDISSLTQKIDKLNMGLFSIDEKNYNNRAELVKLSDIYFHSADGPRENHGNYTLVMIFLAVSVLTLLIACINFINLTVAKLNEEAVEAGIRKVNGASPSRLLYSSLFESIILALISSVIALVLIQISLPVFSNLVGVRLSLNEYLHLKYFLAYAGFGIILGFLAGIFPAKILSSFSPLIYIRKLSKDDKPRSGFRTGLVIFQFTISVVLVISVFVVSKQLSYVRKYDLGFDKENLIKVRMSDNLPERTEVFRERLLSVPGVIDVTYSGSTFDGVNREVFYFNDKQFLTQFFTVEPGFIDALGIEVISGRGFSYDRPSDRLNTCMLNEAAAELLGIEPSEAPGQIITRRDWYITTLPTERVEIIGVIRDFHFTSLRNEVPPVLLCWGNWFGDYNIRISSTDQADIIGRIEKIWNEFNPAIPFEYRFMDEFIDSQYSKDKRMGNILMTFAVLAVLIASFGLLGLSALSIMYRTREIGIKKVFGASREIIIREVSLDFLKWIALSLLIGTPISVYIMRIWLSGFAYRTNVNAWLIFLAWILLLLVSLITILYHTLKISGTNPADSIRQQVF